jgi:hypothetical protein
MLQELCRPVRLILTQASQPARQSDTHAAVVSCNSLQTGAMDHPEGVFKTLNPRADLRIDIHLEGSCLRITLTISLTIQLTPQGRFAGIRAIFFCL